MRCGWNWQETMNTGECLVEYGEVITKSNNVTTFFLLFCKRVQNSWITIISTKKQKTKKQKRACTRGLTETLKYILLEILIVDS